MTLDRRDFLKLAGLGALAAGAGARATAQAGAASTASAPLTGHADYTLRIARSLVELAPDHIVSTVAYNDSVPGPLLRLREGRRVVVDVHNDTDLPEQLHWHGQSVPADVDGAAEEGTPYIPPHGMRRLSFVPGPAGLRFYHTHVVAGSDLTRGQYSGQVGPVYIEPRNEPGAYDREVFLTLKEFDPFFSQGGDMAMDFLRPATPDPALKARGERAMQASLARGDRHGYEVGYQAVAINGSLTNAQTGFVCLNRYRMYRRQGYEVMVVRGTDWTLVRQNKMGIAVRARFGGALELAASMAKTTAAQV